MDARTRMMNALRACDLHGLHVLVAVSGGADSVALLTLLHSVANELGLRLSAAHMEHGIRGNESLSDCAFVEALCDRLSVPLIVRHADIPKEAEISREGLETCARRIRRVFLKEAKAQCGADVIALAHHADDQSETVLMHLLRGSGLNGASGMRMREDDIIRPLLPLRKTEIEEYLLSIGQDFCTDATNAINDNPRNFLRNKVFPSLTTFYPGAVQALNRFAAIAQDEDAWIAREAEKLWSSRVRTYAGIICIENAGDIDVCLIRRIIRRALPQIGFDDAEKARHATGYVQLESGCAAWRAGKNLYLIPNLNVSEEQVLPENGQLVLSGVCILTITDSRPVPVKNDVFTQVLNAEALTGCVLRTRRDGDFIRPFGMNGCKKSLSDYLTDRKFPRPLRDRMPVIARDAEILWAVGAGISETARVNESGAARRLHIEMK